MDGQDGKKVSGKKVDEHRLGELHLGRTDIFFGNLSRKVQGSFFLSGRWRGKRREGEAKPSIFRRVRRSVTKELEQSTVMSGFCSLGRMLLSARLRTFGILLLSFGLWSAAAELLRMILQGDGVLSVDRLWFSAGTILFSLPMLFTGRSVGKAVLQSRCLYFLFFDLLGFYESPFREAKEREGGGFTAFLIGLLLGAVTLFAAPWQILACAAIILCVLLSLMMPETGFLLLLGALPFAPDKVLGGCLVFLWICFALKVVRGKRSFRFGIFEMLLTVYGLFILMGTLFPLSEGANAGEGFLRFFAVSAAFLALELVRSSKTALRCAEMFTFSTVASSLLGILLYALQGVEQFTSGFGFPFSRALMTAFFSAPEEFACFLGMTLTLLPAFSSCLTGDRWRVPFAVSASGLAGLCLLLTWNVPGLLTALFALLIFLFLRRKYTTFGILIVGATVFGCLLPTGLFARFSLVEKLFAHFSEHLALAQGYLRTALSGNLLTGVGSGASAPFSLFLRYGDPAFVGADTSGSLYLQILLENGAVGLVAFAVLLIMLLLYCRYTWRVGIRYTDPFAHRLLCGGTAVIGAVAVMGFFLNPLMSLGTELCFWSIFGVTAGLASSLAETATVGGSDMECDAVLVYRRRRRKK